MEKYLILTRCKRTGNRTGLLKFKEYNILFLVFPTHIFFLIIKLEEQIMKVKFILIPFILLTFLLGFSTGPANWLEGAWEMVSGKLILPDQTIEMPRTESEHAIKVINKTHFATVHQDTSTNDIYSNAGTYTLTEDTYTENLEYATSITMIGKTYCFKSTIEGDKWIISGPVEKPGAEVPEWKIHEVWKRVK
jgi:hypothetical protein